MRISLNNDVYAFPFFVYSLHKRLTDSLPSRSLRSQDTEILFSDASCEF